MARVKFDIDEQEITGGYSAVPQSVSQTQEVVKPDKDNWDKIAAIAPIISGVMIFVMGGYFTYSYNQQQLRLQEIQTIEKFIPHLMGNEQSKRAAILAISSLTNAELAGNFAQIFASQGTVSALQSIAENGSQKDKTAATTALAQALENLAARESRLNEMEDAFEKALKEKHQGGETATQQGLEQLDEATRLERLAAMCKERGQTAVGESLLKQAQAFRARSEVKAEKAEEKLPLPPPPPAAGTKQAIKEEKEASEETKVTSETNAEQEAQNEIR